MNNKTISKIIALTIIIFSLVACMSTTAFADNQIDLEALTGNTPGNNTNTENEPTDDDVPSLDGTINNPGTTPDETPSTTPPAETPDTTPDTTPGNTSTYEETDIPYAGPAETMLMTTAFIVFGIIGVYTFVKMSDYSNI